MSDDVVPTESNSSNESALVSSSEQQRLGSLRRLQVAFMAFVGLLLVALWALVFLLVSHIFSYLSPAIQADLEWKAQRGAAELARTAEIGIALRDVSLIDGSLRPYLDDKDILSVVVTEANGEVIASHGRPPEPAAKLFSSRQNLLRRENGYFTSWAQAEIEGGVIGKVAVTVSTARIHAGTQLQRQIVLGFGLGALLALGVTFVFVSLYVGPILRVTRAAFKRLEETTHAALAAVRVKSEFIANISHEIRTPMNGVLGMLELLHRTELSAKQAKHLGTLQSSAQALMAVLDDVLDFAKIEAGKLKVRSDRCDPRALVNEVVELFQARSELKGLSLSSSIADDVPWRVHLDKDRIRQILSNFVGNAVKFTETGSVTLHLGVVAVNDHDCQLKFEVRDTGPGIPQDAISYLFEAFSQVDGSVTRKQGGTGLGLAICRKLAVLLGGTVGVESELGKGSCFWVQVPTELASSTPSLSPSAVPDASQSTTSFAGRGIRILVADDNPINREILGELLTALGCDFDCVDDGHAAVRAVEQRAYSLVLMDCQMPGLDGYEATRQIRLQEAGARHVPIVAATAHAFESERGKTAAAGMDDHLPKPISMQSLATMIARWVPEDLNPKHSAAPGIGQPPLKPERPEQSATRDRPEKPVLDPEVPRSAAVVRVFKAHVPEQLERIRRAISAASREELAQAAHRLKGSCTMFGAPRMAEICLDLERGTGDATILIDRLVEEHEGVLAQLPSD